MEKVIEESEAFTLSFGDEVWISGNSKGEARWLQVIAVHQGASGTDVFCSHGDLGSEVIHVPDDNMVMSRWTVRTGDEMDEDERHKAAIDAIRLRTEKPTK